MENLKGALLLASSLCIFGACSSGGGGGGSAAVTTPATTTPATPTVPVVSISGPASLSSGGASSGGATSTFNFNAGQPPVGTVLPLPGGAVRLQQTSVADAGLTAPNQITIEGTTTSNGRIFPIVNLSIPGLSVNATNLLGDGTIKSLPDGSQISFTAGPSNLSYVLLGVWLYTPASSTSLVIGQTTTGFLTAPANVPTTGTANYNNNAAGTVLGTYFVPNGDGTIQSGVIQGTANVSVNFGNGAVTGTLSNMTSLNAANNITSPWNNVTLSGNLLRQANSATLSGTTSTAGAPAGAGTAGFSSAATGTMAGDIYGPNAEEVGGTWTLSETTAGGGKAAFGTFSGKQ